MQLEMLFAMNLRQCYCTNISLACCGPIRTEWAPLPIDRLERIKLGFLFHLVRGRLYKLWQILVFRLE